MSIDQGMPLEKFPVQTKFAIDLGVKRPVGLVDQSHLRQSVSCSLTSFCFFPSAWPARAVIIPNNFYLADIAEESATLDHFARSFRVRFAAMLGAHLYDAV